MQTPQQFETIDDTDRADWLDARAQGIGGSDAATVLGLNPYKSPFALFAEKVGLTDPSAETEAMEWGKKLEAAILRAYSEKTGRILVAPHDVALILQDKAPALPGIAMDLAYVLSPVVEVAYGPDSDGRVVFRSKARPWQLGTVDAFVLDDDRGFGVVDAKNIGARGRDRWADENGDPKIPDYYLPQTNHYCDLFGFTWGSFAVLFGGQSFGWLDHDFDDSLATRSREACVEFLRRIEENDAPPADGSPSTADALAQIYPDDSGDTVQLDPELVPLVDELAELSAQVKDLSDWKKNIETQIKAAIGSATFGVLPNGKRFSLKAQSRESVSVKDLREFVSRDLPTVLDDALRQAVKSIGDVGEQATSVEGVVSRALLDLVKTSSFRRLIALRGKK